MWPIVKSTPYGDTPVVLDRLGSARNNGASYFPYGESRQGGTTGAYQFATYYRDTNNLDYAGQRYYSSQLGRFLTTDPSMVNVSLADPSSWNAYAYVNGDPVNRNDPTGLGDDEGGYCWLYPGDPRCYAFYGGPTDDEIYSKNGRKPIGRTAADARRAALQLARTYLPGAEGLAEQAIKKPDCYGLFGSRPDGTTATQVLAGMISGTQYGKIQFTYNPNDTSVATTRPTISPGNLFGVSSTVIKINAGSNDYGYWNSGDTVENADTLLHELGHVLRFLGFTGGDFQQDDKNDAINQRNSALIKEKCLDDEKP